MVTAFNMLASYRNHSIKTEQQVKHAHLHATKSSVMWVHCLHWSPNSPHRCHL